MKVLCVTPLWKALKTAFETGESDNGMPGFFRPVFELKKRGYQIDFIILSDDPDFRDMNDYKFDLIPSSSVKEVIFFKIEKGIKKFRSLKVLCKNLRHVTRRVLQEEQYCFVYGQSSYSISAIDVAGKMGIPCGQRMYGTFLWDRYVKVGFFRSILSDPLEVLSFNKKKSFILITDDGTNGDRAFSKFSFFNRNVPFYFWKNGVDRLEIPDDDQVQQLEQKYSIFHPSAFYLARIARWKRQEKAYKTVRLLKERGIVLHLYLAGQYDEDYFGELNALGDSLGISDQIHYLGTLSRKESSVLARICDFSLIMYDMSCLGNVFHELFSDGALLVCDDPNHSLKDYIVNGVNGFALNTTEQVADVIADICDGRIDPELIRNQARETSKKLSVTWEKRIKDEVDLIEAVRKKS